MSARTVTLFQVRSLAFVLLFALATSASGAHPASPQGELEALQPQAQGEGAGDEAEPAATPTVFAEARDCFDAFWEAKTKGRSKEELLETVVPGLDEAQALAGLDALYEVILRTELPPAGALRSRETLVRPGARHIEFDLVFDRHPELEYRIAKQTLEEAQAFLVEHADLRPLAETLESLPLLERFRLQLRSRLPEVLTAKPFLIENWQWIGLLVLAFLAVVVDRAVRFVLGRLARRATSKEAVHLDTAVLSSFERPAGILVGALLFDLLLPALGLRDEVRNVIALSLGVVATVAGVWAAYRLVDVFCDYLSGRARRSRNRFDDMLVPLLRRTLKIFVIVVGMVFVASRLSEDLWGVVAGLGIGSLAIGFAARDSIENLFGTFTVLLDKPFAIGDWITVGDLEGTVEEVGFRSTRIRTFYDSLITVPNREFISSDVDNMGERRYRRIKATLGLTYDTPPEKVEAFCEGVRQVIRSHPYTRKDYYHVYLTGLGDSALEILLYCFVAAPEWATELREKHRLFADILRLAEKLEVDFAFPTQTLHLTRSEGRTHGPSPATDLEGAERGRRAADEIVARTLEPFGGVGHRPAPVRIHTRPVEPAADSD